jgi:hypothetical protein
MYRIIYKSRSRVPLDWDIVRDILHTSEAYNESHGITGVLLASNTHFLQVLEGNYEEVNSAFMRIVCDERHTEIRLVAFSIIDARLFGGWGMRGIGAFDFNKDLEQQLIAKYGEEECWR